MRLGDFVEKLISVVTLGQGKKIAMYIAKLRGKEDCGCKRRKDILNNLPKVEHFPIPTPKPKINKNK